MNLPGFCQNFDDLPPKAKEYIDMLNSYLENIIVNREEFSDEIEAKELQKIDMLQLTLYKVTKIIESLSNEEFKNLIMLRNAALEEAPYEVEEYFESDAINKSQKLQVNSIKIPIKVSALDGIIVNIISKKYGKIPGGIHRIPILAKVKIVGSSNEEYKGVPGLKVSLINYEAVVEDILRGSNELVKDKHISFHIIKQLKRTKEEFVIGKSYFIGCTTIIDDFGKKRLALWNDGIYMVDNNRIIDKTNTFNFGENIQWNIFKKKISDILILNNLDKRIENEY